MYKRQTYEGRSELTRYLPGSQSRAILDEKERLAIRLLSQGLTVTQISKQLRCSPQFVRQARARLARPADATPQRLDPSRSPA